MCRWDSASSFTSRLRSSNSLIAPFLSHSLSSFNSESEVLNASVHGHHSFCRSGRPLVLGGLVRSGRRGLLHRYVFCCSCGAEMRGMYHVASVRICADRFCQSISCHYIHNSVFACLPSVSSFDFSLAPSFAFPTPFLQQRTPGAQRFHVRAPPILP